MTEGNWKRKEIDELAERIRYKKDEEPVKKKKKEIEYEREDTKEIRYVRKWVMPNACTFQMKPVRELLDKYIPEGKELIVVDPFARDSKYGTLTNDISPKTDAKNHMDAVDFLNMLIDEDTVADVVLFDPPYSPRQISECYKDMGKVVTGKDTQNASLYKKCKERLAKILRKGGIAISFGWNSGGLGKLNGCEIVDGMILSHGSAHNDTIVTVEIKL